MQTHPEPNPAPIEGEPDVSIANPEQREADELRMLLIGMTIGLSVGGFFLIYVVMAAAGLLR